jgi:hypothetical protein
MPAFASGYREVHNFIERPLKHWTHQLELELGRIAMQPSIM